MTRCRRRCRAGSGLPSFRDAVRLLHNAAGEDRAGRAAGAAPPGVAPRQVRRAARPAALHARLPPAPSRRGRPCAVPRGKLTRALVAALPFRLTRAQRRALARAGARPRAAPSDAAAAAGRRGQRQDGGRRARRPAMRGERLPGRGDGAHRDTGRAALPSVLAVARAARACASRGLRAGSRARRSARRSRRWRRAARRSRSAPTR